MHVMVFKGLALVLLLSSNVLPSAHSFGLTESISRRRGRRCTVNDNLEDERLSNRFLCRNDVRNAVTTESVVSAAHPFCISTTSLSSSPRPIDGNAWPYKFPAKEHCSKCGLCETTLVSRVTDACPFLNQGMGRIDPLETIVHGRGRHGFTTQPLELQPNFRNNDASSSTTSITNAKNTADEARFGVQYTPMQLVKAIGINGAQWTGSVTSIAVAILESGMVDAVVCIAAQDNTEDESTSSSLSSWCSPEPIVAKTVDDVLRGRGVKPALAPSLKVLDQIRHDPSIRMLLFCGVGCAVQAFRAVESELGLDQVYVLGTNCADNSPTPQAARNFLEQGFQLENEKVEATSVTGYEFMPDFRVQVKTKSKLNENGNEGSGYLTKPYFCLPGTVAKSSIAPSCLACFDYTNALADVVIGYMAAPYQAGNSMTKSYQTITVRNARGAAMVQAAASRLQLSNIANVPQQAHESLAMATLQSDAIIQDMIGGKVRDQGMPIWMGEIMSNVMSTLGPKGVSFARYSIDYHILRNYLHVLSEWGMERTERQQLPQYARDIVQHYRTKYPAMQDLINKVQQQKQKSL